MLSTFGGFWAEWSNPHKVTFSGPEKIIYINPGITLIDVKNDLYSDWKEWMTYYSGANAQYLPAMKAVGGDPISDTKALGSTFFLLNGWKIKPWEGHTNISIQGNIYTDDGSRPIIPDNNGNDSVSMYVSTLVDTVIIDVSANDNEPPLWNGPIGIIDCYQDGKFITARWSSATDINQVNYKVFISNNLNILFDNINLYGVFTGNMANISTFADGVTPLDNETYYIAVRAIDSAGNETTNTNYAIVNYDISVGNPLTAQEIWEYTTRTLTNTSITAQDVWSYATRELTAGAGLDETQLHTALNTYANKNDWKADVSTIDLSTIPASVWTYVSRELTVAAGLTPAQEAKLNDIISNTTNIDTQVWSSPSKDNTADIRYVNGVAVYNINEFKNDDTLINSKLDSKPALLDIESSLVLAKKTDISTSETNISNKLDSKPALLDIENSLVLAKKADISIVETIINSLPLLDDFRNEMINVTFGGLEIANDQLTIKDKSGTIIAIFNLLDKLGQPTMNQVFKREVVL